MTQPLAVSIAGATGWAGSALARGVASSADLTLVSGVSRSHSGTSLGEALAADMESEVGRALLDAPVYTTVEEALAARATDVLVEYTKPNLAKSNVLTALEHGAHVVVGTSGLTDEDYLEIHAAAKAANKGVLAAGNFALTVVLLMKFAETAARLIPHWEIVDYAHATKIDAPSGTVRELASRLGKASHAQLAVPIADTVGEKATRGATMGTAQVHSVRLPGFTLGTEVLFGLPDQRLSIRTDAGTSAEPYVDGALIAIRKVGTFTGLRRGLDSVLDL
ncbi:MAG TPA: 4-hydroxy-tetrahydrodipicolinate reductase [Trueperaceae bacterium]|nr:4-hydroxy-tetrahydrodipicolinate reductase [Trueperaceae bacterium]